MKSLAIEYRINGKPMGLKALIKMPKTLAALEARFREEYPPLKHEPLSVQASMPRIGAVKLTDESMKDALEELAHSKLRFMVFVDISRPAYDIDPVEGSDSDEDSPTEDDRRSTKKRQKDKVLRLEIMCGERLALIVVPDGGEHIKVAHTKWELCRIDWIKNWFPEGHEEMVLYCGSTRLRDEEYLSELGLKEGEVLTLKRQKRTNGSGEAST